MLLQKSERRGGVTQKRLSTAARAAHRDAAAVPFRWHSSSSTSAHCVRGRNSSLSERTREASSKLMFSSSLPKIAG